MPNLSEGWALIIGTVLGAFISIFGIVLTMIFNERQRKADSQDRFFYEVYPKRLAIYEEALKELNAMIESGESLGGPGLTREAAIDKIAKDTHFLNNLLARLRVLGSPACRSIFETVISKSHDFCVDLEKGHYVPLMLGGWAITIKDVLDKFIQVIREDIGGNSLDITIRGHFATKK
jgi:hypothetical protein